MVVKKKKGAVSLAALLLLVLSGVSVASSVRRRRRCYRINKDGIKVPAGYGSKYETYVVSLRKPPNADAMDDGAWRRWYESFLPTSTDFMDDDGWHHLHKSFLTDSMDDEPRFFNCYMGHDDTCFLLVGLTGVEPLVVANKPGVLSK